MPELPFIELKDVRSVLSLTTVKDIRRSKMKILKYSKYQKDLYSTNRNHSAISYHPKGSK